MKYTLENYTLEKYEQDKFLVDAIHLRVPCFGKKRIEDALELANILKKYGYKGLRVGSNKDLNSFVSLDKLVRSNPERIVLASQRVYFEALKRINKFGNPLKNPVSPYNKKEQNLENKLDIEEDGQLRFFS